MARPRVFLASLCIIASSVVSVSGLVWFILLDVMLSGTITLLRTQILSIVALIEYSGSMERAIKRSTIVVMVVVPLLGGCQSHTWLLYANPPATGAKEGEQCATVLFGLGPNVDLSGNEAIRRGGISKPTTVEYRMNSFHGMGKECVLARGD